MLATLDLHYNIRLILDAMTWMLVFQVVFFLIINSSLLDLIHSVCREFRVIVYFIFDQITVSI